MIYYDLHKKLLKEERQKTLNEVLRMLQKNIYGEELRAPVCMKVVKQIQKLKDKKRGLTNE